MLVSVLQAAGPLAPGDKYPQVQHHHQHRHHQQQVQHIQHTPLLHHLNQQSFNTSPTTTTTPEGDKDPSNPTTSVIMTGNGFFLASANANSNTNSNSASTSNPNNNGNSNGNANANNPNSISGNTGLSKSKSGSLPDRYARGFRDTFVSNMTPPPNQNPSSANHQFQYHNPSNPSPQESKESGSASKKWTFGGFFKRKGKTGGTSGSGNLNSQSPTNNTNGLRTSSHSPKSMPMSPSPLPGTGSHGSHGSPLISSNPQSQSPRVVVQHLGPVGNLSKSPNMTNISKMSASSVVNTNNGNKYVSTPTQTRHRMSESDITSDSSDLGDESYSQMNQKPQTNAQPPPTTFKQNFLTRRLSRRREKAAAKSAKKKQEQLEQQQQSQLQSTNHTNFNNFNQNLQNQQNYPNYQNGFLKVPSNKNKLNQNLNGYGKRVGSSPDSLNNTGNGPWPSWEITKKVPHLQQAANYSSSGSLSLSQEGSTKGSRAAAKEAVKARAVARRESFIRDTSSEDDEALSVQGSVKGSNSSLVNRRRPYPLSNGIGNNNSPNSNPNYQGQGPFRPAVDYVRNSPKQLRSSSSPNNFQRKLGPPVNGQAPGSPRWEARVVYTQENLENQTPFVVKLPGRQSKHRNSQHAYVTTESASEGDHHQVEVITAGLRVPIAPPGNNPSGRHFITEEVHYANLPNNSNPPVRFRSATPTANYGYNNVTPSPPPPPPRRDNANLHRQVLNNQNQNPNFYRPVSCSYLDSYQGYYNYNQNQNQRDSNSNPSPNPNNLTTFATRSPVPYSNQHQQQQNNQNYYYEDQVDNVQHYPEPKLLKNNNLLNPNKHQILTKSPSEPPEIKVQYARDSPVRHLQRNASTPSPMSYQPVQQEQVQVTSKLGFPVRRLDKIPPAQSPVHMRASEFWRKKEAEVTGLPVQPNPNHQKYMNRIRSAESSPLPVPRNRVELGVRNSQLQNASNESISSLSSASPSPHNNGKMAPRIPRKVGNQNQNSESSPNQHLSKSDRETPNANQSACERLKVRIPSAPSQSQGGQSPEDLNKNKLRSLVELNNGKTPGRNLEDALNELEDMYKSLRLSDEDLLDRAERRDLPTPHQELRNAPLIPLPRYEPYGVGSVESLATGSASGTSSGSGNGGGGNSYGIDILNPNKVRVRAPPMRRSARPDTVQDDMARRRFDSPETKALDPRNVVSKTGSYMVFSPAFSPPVSPCPPENLPLSYYPYNHEDPDLTLDDVSFRHYRKANSIRIIDPQPKFGIPLGPITAAPGSDYLHSSKSDRLRPLFKATKNPDLINDDIAFRNLRKDLNSENNLSKDWTPRLFSPTRGQSPSGLNPKQLRAIRSLSANVTNFVPFTEFSFNTTDIGKWNSFTDLHRRPHSSSPSQGKKYEKFDKVSPYPRRASTYFQPSWVEQVEKVSYDDEPQEWERKMPRKTVQLTPDLYDPSKPRRPWTESIFDEFEKERQEQERIKKEAEEKNKNANNPSTIDDDDDVFLDARDQSKSISNSASPEDLNRNKMPVPEKFTKFSQIPPPEGLLSGQINRRGSWVEPSRSNANYLTSFEGYEDSRRKSWSDLPKDNVFNPLPPPRKIKQIKIEAFNPDNQGPKDTEQKLVESNSQFPPQTRSRNQLTKGEEELNELMDMLIREADTCGNISVGSSNGKSQTMDPINSINSRDTEDVTKFGGVDVDKDLKATSTSTSTSSSQRKRETRESRERPARALVGVTQKDSLELDAYLDSLQLDLGSRKRVWKPVPKIPQKESQIDEPTIFPSASTSRISRVSSDVQESKSKKSKSLSNIQDEDSTTTTTITTTNTTNSRMDNSPRITMTNADTGNASVESNLMLNCPNSSISTGITDSDTTTKNLRDSRDARIATSSRPLTPKPIEIDDDIDRLIDSMNESLPELQIESQYLLYPTKNSNSVDTKSHGSSSLSSGGSGSPPFHEVPSPRGGSPTTIVLEGTDKIQEFERENDAEEILSRKNSRNLDISDVSGINLPILEENKEEKADRAEESMRNVPELKPSDQPGPSREYNKKSEEEPGKNARPNERTPEVSHFPQGESANTKSHFPFLRKSTSRSRSPSKSNSLIGSVSSSPTTGSGSEFGDLKKEKDKSQKRKSYLNRAFTDEPVPEQDTTSSSFHLLTSINNETSKSNSQVAQEPLDNHTSLNRKSSFIYKVPPIPSILCSTSNNGQDTNSINNSNPLPIPNTKLHLPSSSSPKNIENSPKTWDFQVQQRKSSPVVKRDSFSDAEGVSFIKKLLHKESLAEKEKTKELASNSNGSGFLLKKSPSVGSTPYTNNKEISKFSSKPAFLKKFFEKEKQETKEKFEKNSEANLDNLEKSKNSNSNHQRTSSIDSLDNVDNEIYEMAQDQVEEPVIGFSVAQKASFFMKLEHEQRFSKWRKNSLDGSSVPIQTPVPTNESANKFKSGQEISKRSSRQLTQPVTTSEVNLAVNTVVVGENCENVEYQQFQSLTPESNVLEYVPAERETEILESEDNQEDQCSTSTGREPSQLSLKDRVHMFDKLIAVGAKAPSSSGTPLPQNVPIALTRSGSGFPFPMIHSSSSSQILQATNPTQFQSQIPIATWATPSKYKVNEDSNENDLGPLQFQRRGSTSDIDLTTPKYSPVLNSHKNSSSKRNSKSRSMFVNDDMSEDAEYSSGGQEVAEIISRSYENSPVARKKSWRSQKEAQATFTKEIWRRCKVNDGWGAPQVQRPVESRYPQQTYKVTTNVTHTHTHTILNEQNQPKIPPVPSIPLGNSDPSGSNQNQSSNSPPTTSNLLQILTVLSSSNDELDEKSSRKSKQNSTNDPSYSNNSTRRLGNSSPDRIGNNFSNFTTYPHLNSHQVHVPHPDDESFQLFFGNSESSFSSNACIMQEEVNPCENGINFCQMAKEEMNVVRRESDLLVMKKNMPHPLVRRKSSGKSRNPLRALAARMDFRNQWYTDNNTDDIDEDTTQGQGQDTN